jgi:hypothetical protein
MYSLRCSQAIRTDTEMRDVLLDRGVFSPWPLAQLLQEVSGIISKHRP